MKLDYKKLRKKNVKEDLLTCLLQHLNTNSKTTFRDTSLLSEIKQNKYKTKTKDFKDNRKLNLYILKSPLNKHLTYMWKENIIPNYHFRNEKLHKINLSNIELTGFCFSEGSFSKCDFSSTHFERASLTNCNFVQSYLKNVTLRLSDLNKVTLTGSNLEGLSIRNSFLTHVRLNNCILMSSEIILTQLSGVDLRGSNLTKCKLENVSFYLTCFDDKTKWPCNFNLDDYHIGNTEYHNIFYISNK